MKAVHSAARAALNPPRSLFTFATDVKGVSFSFFLSPPPSPTPPFATSERSLWVSSPASFSMQSCESREREKKKKSSEKHESACFATRLKPTLVINFLSLRAVKQSTKHLEGGGGIQIFVTNEYSSVSLLFSLLKTRGLLSVPSRLATRALLVSTRGPVASPRVLVRAASPPPGGEASSVTLRFWRVKWSAGFSPTASSNLRSVFLPWFIKELCQK